MGLVAPRGVGPGTAWAAREGASATVPVEQPRGGELLGALEPAVAHAAEAVEVPHGGQLLAAPRAAEDGERKRRLRAEQVQLLLCGVARGWEVGVMELRTVDEVVTRGQKAVREVAGGGRAADLRVRVYPPLRLRRELLLSPPLQVEDEDARVEAVLLEGQRLLVALLEARLAAAGGGWRCESRWSWWSLQVEASRWLVSPAACRL